MQGKGLVFVTGDRLGDQLTALLEEAGCQVVRGPQPQPPALTVFPREEWPRWFGETDVIVASPRDVCSREVMAAAPRLRAVVSSVIGVDTIDMDAANTVDLTTLLRTSDVVSVHVTLTSETRHMLGAAELRLMQPHAYLINTARGGAIDAQALYQVLRDRAIAGAALDVFEPEPLPMDSPL